MKAAIQRAIVLLSGALTFLLTPDTPAQPAALATDQAALRVLIITGGHDHEAAFYGLFDGYEDIGWPAVTDSTLAFKQDIRVKYDVLVFYNFTRDMDDNGKKNLRDFVESGKGIVVLHHGILNFQKWPWWYEEVVGGLYRLESKNGVPNSTVKFGEEHLITAAGRHPITDGITPFGVGLVNWNSSPSGTSAQGGTSWDTGAYRTVFTGVEFACGATAQFNSDVAAIYNYLRGSSTSVDPVTWGAVKSMYNGR